MNRWIKLFVWSVVVPVMFFVFFPIFAAGVALVAKFIGLWWIQTIGAWWHYWLTI